MSLLLAGILLIAAVCVAIPLIAKAISPPKSQATSSCQDVVVPAYFYPGAEWTRADNSRPTPTIMILDITGSGAGRSPDRMYQAAVTRARAAGMRIMGYSTTSYAQRAATAVEADIRNYKSWYGVTDIFLDEVSSSTAQIAYYRHLADYAHSVNPGSMVMLNPGTYPNRQYMSVGDVVMVYENTYANFLGVQVPKWAHDYPAAKFAYTIYATSSSQMANAISLSQRRRAGYVYVTDGTGSDPYDSLPSYWSNEDAAIAAECAGTRVSATGRDYAARRAPM